MEKKSKAKIIQKVDAKVLLDCINKIGAATKFFEEDQLVVIYLDKDKDFGYDVMIFFVVEGEEKEWVKMYARANAQRINYQDTRILSNALIQINKYNEERRVGRAYIEKDIEDGHFVLEEDFYANEPVSYEWLTTTIKLFINSAWGFFCDYANSIESLK